MILEITRFKIVIIDYPIFCFEDAFTSDLLARALKMKYEGYSATYNDGVLPMDKSDFFGTHMILCEETKAKLIPIIAFKSAPLDRCLKYGYEFPAVSLMKNDGHPSCLKIVNEIIQKVGDPSLISYDSSWAQALGYRFSGQPAIKQKLREITNMMIIMHHREFNVPHILACGSVKVKTDQFFLTMGFKKLNEHAHFNQKGLNNEESVIFYSDTFSDSALPITEELLKLWGEKIVVSGLAKAQMTKKAA